jgi:hypothetical protein
MGKIKIDFRLISSVVLFALSVVSVLVLGAEIYLFGFRQGADLTDKNYQDLVARLSKDRVSSYIPVKPQETVKPTVSAGPKPQPKKPDWGGPDLWEVVNTARVNHGVNPLKGRDELCTVASIRLNELLSLGKLDGHQGFAKLTETREDLKWIFEKYVMAEFLVQGAQTPEEAVDLWLNTLGHKKLITGGEYVYGCTYAQEGFGVAIVAYE